MDSNTATSFDWLTPDLIVCDIALGEWFADDFHLWETAAIEHWEKSEETNLWIEAHNKSYGLDLKMNKTN